MNFLQKISFLSILVFAVACENDIDINADFEEVAVVYGLLDHNADTQFVKINKTFLDDNVSALDLAKEPSRLNYDSLKVSLIEETTKNEFFLSPIILPKDPGTFTDQDNIIYYTVNQLKPNAIYNLKIEKMDSTFTTGKTTTIDNIAIEKPNPNLPGGGTVAFVDRNDKISSYNFKFETGNNVAEFEIAMYFKYTEIIGVDSFPKRAYIPLTKIYNPGTKPGIEYEFRFDGLRFFDAIETQVPATVNPTKKVIFPSDNIEIHIFAADEDYSFYRELNGPIDGLAQTRPEFTNLTNGYGLFSSRLSLVANFKLDNFTLNYIVGTYKDTRNFSYP